MGQTTCAFCGRGFDLSARRRGPAPTYCSQAHRQRAYEARLTQPSQEAPASPADLAEVLAETHQLVAAAPGNLRAVSTAYRRLAAAVEASLTAPPAAPPPPVTALPPEPVPVTYPRRRPRRGGKAWKVVFHAAGADPAAGEVLSAHTTEGAAEGARRRYREAWESRQAKAEIPRWDFSVVADPEDALGERYDRAEAKARAARLVVRIRPRDQEVTYRRYPDEKRPTLVVHVVREDAAMTEALSSRWYQGPDGYVRSTRSSSGGDHHNYAHHLLMDACNLAYLARRDAPRRLALLDAIEAFVAEVLNPRGETYTISAAEIRHWLEDRGLVAVVAGASR